MVKRFIDTMVKSFLDATALLVLMIFGLALMIGIGVVIATGCVKLWVTSPALAVFFAAMSVAAALLWCKVRDL